MFGIKYNILETKEGRSIAITKNELKKFIPKHNDGTHTGRRKEQFDAIVVFFDLQGFTEFCSQHDSYLIVPSYIERFQNWLFIELAKLFTKSSSDNTIFLWDYLPTFWKFTGDGAFFIWRIDHADFDGNLSIGNIVVRCQNLSRHYKEFVNNIRREVVNPPEILRCGIARGSVIPIQNHADYVGSCINIASRLQKVRTLTFAVQQKGIAPIRCFTGKWENTYIQKKLIIRGINREELILVDKNEFDKLSDREREGLLDP